MNFKKLMPYLTFVFVIVVGYVLFRSLSSLDWAKIKEALQNVPFHIFLPGLSLSLINYTILSHYDYLGIRFFKLPLGYLRSLISAFFCYVFNLNLGSLVGGLAFRFRIYMGWGISKEKVPLIMLFSTITNWTGYLFLVSLLMSFEPTVVSVLIDFSLPVIRFIGLVGIAVVAVYFVLCCKSYKMSFKGNEFKFPSCKLAATQMLLSCTQWCIMAVIVYTFFIYFKIDITYRQVLFTYLMASIAGLIAHIPAGLGVIEAIFLKLRLEVNSEDLVIALICFRIVYYLVPLLIALPGYLYLEFFQRKRNE